VPKFKFGGKVKGCVDVDPKEIQWVMLTGDVKAPKIQR